MKICIVTPYELSLDGGVNKHVFNLARALRAKGDEVAVIGPASGPTPDDPDVTAFGGVVSIQGNESDNRIGIFTSPLAVGRYMRTRQFDVVHVHEPFVPSLPYYALWTTTAPARVATFHCYNEQETRVTRLVRKALSPYLWSFQRGIAVSTAAARYAEAAWSRPLSIIPNGTDTSFFAPSAQKPAAGALPVIGGDRQAGPLKLLFVGQWTDKRKGLPVLLEAFARLKARKIDVTLDVIGQGDPRIPTPSLTNGVTFHGRVSEQELRRRFRECDIFVAPSTGRESFGIVLVEAMASGRPVVCSDIDGYRDVATRQGAILVPPRDPSSLAEALQRLARDPALRRSMGQHNRIDALKYDWNAVASQIREEYLMALTAPAREQPISARAWVAGQGLLLSARAQTAAAAPAAAAAATVVDEPLRPRAASQ